MKAFSIVYHMTNISQPHKENVGKSVLSLADSKRTGGRRGWAGKEEKLKGNQW
jgi:hypothetical protein